MIPAIPRPYFIYILLGLAMASCAPAVADRAAYLPPVPPGRGQVARVPHGAGLQYCLNLSPRDLAPVGARNVFVHSLSVYVTSSDPAEPALAAITGRYPGWDTLGTTIYNQSFSNTNTVWLEIIHEFPLGISCLEVYGHDLRPSHYSAFKDRILVSYTYQPGRGHGENKTKFFAVTWQHYLPRYAPLRRPKH